MQAYRAYYENGQFVTVESPSIPEGSELIITVLDSSIKKQDKRPDFSSLRGLAADSNLTVDKFLAMTHDEKEMK